MSRPAVWIGFGCFALVALSTSPAFAQRDLKDIPDPDPEIERKSFIVADGFEVNLFAADPLLHKPIQMNFDPQGRLWMAASEIYPQIAPGQKANDKILVLEDTDGDPPMADSDKTTIFADGLLIPTGVEPGDDGVRLWRIAASTELLHLKDTDGDGKADESRVVLSGFDTEDTHLAFSIDDCRFSIGDDWCQVAVALHKSKIKNHQSKISPPTSPFARST